MITRAEDTCLEKQSVAYCQNDRKLQRYRGKLWLHSPTVAYSVICKFQKYKEQVSVYACCPGKKWPLHNYSFETLHITTLICISHSDCLIVHCCYIMADHFWAQQSCVMRSDLQGWTMSTDRHDIAIVDSLDFALIWCHLKYLKHRSTDKVFYYNWKVFHNNFNEYSCQIFTTKGPSAPSAGETVCNLKWTRLETKM